MAGRGFLHEVKPLIMKKYPYAQKRQVADDGGKLIPLM